MKTSKIVKVEVILNLNEQEANWLRRYTQNYNGDDVEDEPIDDYEMRKMFFNALQNVLNTPEST